MHIKRISTNSEWIVEQQVRRAVAGTDWTFAPKFPIQSVLGKDESLSDAEFSMFTRGHFDFVIYHKDWERPAFAVEFDGFGHESPEGIARDLIKNDLCAAARFPLIRIGKSEILEQQHISVLEWLVGVFIASIDDLDAMLSEDDGQDDDEREEVGEDLNEIDEDEFVDEQGYPTDDGPSEFENEHPFPANASLLRRLKQRYGIGSEIYTLNPAERRTSHVVEVKWPGRHPMRIERGRTCDFVVSERDVAVRGRSDLNRVLYSSLGLARFAITLNLPAYRRRATGNLTSRALGRPCKRVPVDFFDPHSIARELACFDALIQVDRWAELNLAQAGR